MRENDAGKVFVANLSSAPIDSIEEFNDLFLLALLPILFLFQGLIKTFSLQVREQTAICGSYTAE